MLADVLEVFLKDSASRIALGDIKPNTLSCFYRPYCNLLRRDCGHWKPSQIKKSKVDAYRRQLFARQLRLADHDRKLPLGSPHGSAVVECQGFLASIEPDLVRCPRRERRERIPTQEEIDRLMNAARPDVRDVLEMLLHLPLRPGDCFSMRRSWVDLDANLIRLADSKTGPRLVCCRPLRVKYWVGGLTMLTAPTVLFLQQLAAARGNFGISANLCGTGRVSRPVWTLNFVPTLFATLGLPMLC